MLFKRLEEIEVWKHGCRLAVDIYKFVESDPLAKNWGLRDQIQRSAVSIPSNIAEGYERDSTAEFRRFVLIAKGSCGEVRSMYYAAEDLGYVTAEIALDRRERAVRISKGIASLTIRVRTSKTKKHRF